ncbi:hypothetical protein LCGC14_1126960 [marine sediment metagenome]|uniref:Uncharacterized protein n=1 Tax=marine sediment metagenome TaxID=412755 RepID=A0A0F9Q819_9ZZZZ
MQVNLTDIGIDFHGSRIMEDSVSRQWYLADKSDAKFIDMYGFMRIDFMPFEGNS